MGVSLPWMRSKSGDGGGGGGEVVVNKDFRRGWEGVVRSWACLAVRFSHLLARLQTPLHKYQEGHDVSLFMREDLYLYTSNLHANNNWPQRLWNHFVLNRYMSFNKNRKQTQFRVRVRLAGFFFSHSGSCLSIWHTSRHLFRPSS